MKYQMKYQMEYQILNKLQIKGTDEQIMAVLNFIKKDNSESLPERGIGTIDFNKIEPMPKWVKRGLLSISDLEECGTEESCTGWKIDNWGSRQNAFSCRYKSKYPLTIIFKTFGGSPIVLIKKLSIIFPEVSLRLLFVDEKYPVNHGINGIIEYQNGEVIRKFFPLPGSNEANGNYYWLHKTYFKYPEDEVTDYLSKFTAAQGFDETLALAYGEIDSIY